MSAPQQRQTGSMGDELTNAALIGLVGMFGIALILRAAGSVSALLTGAPQPEAGPASGLDVLFNPGNPAAALDSDELNSVAYWITTAVMLAGLVAAGVWAWVRLHRHSRKVETDPRRLVGTATNHDVAQTASPKALLRRAGTLRPSLNDPDPGDVGYRIGTSKGREVWASVEDSILLIGPPRSGKGLHIVIPAILVEDGVVFSTSTIPENLSV
ncbi:MAG: type VI secretion protein, partial [Microbacterium sp.]